MNNNVSVKLITVGDAGVGKTCIIYRFTKNTFNADYNNTVGLGLFQKNVNINSQMVTLKIWDTAGQERYDCITKNYFEKSDGAFIVFDLTSRESFHKAQHWIDTIKEYGCIQMVLVGNKCDLEQERTVNSREANLFAYDNGRIPYFETSALTGVNIEESFMCLARYSLSNAEVPIPQPIPAKEHHGCSMCKK